MKSKIWKLLLQIGVVGILILIGGATNYLVSAADETNEKYTPTVPINAVQQDNPQEVAATLVDQWLSHWKASINVQKRLASYEIHHIMIHERQGEDFAVGVTFSVKPIMNCLDSLAGILCSEWIAGNGILEKDGWIRRKFLLFKIIRERDGYALQMLGTGP